MSVALELSHIAVRLGGRSVLQSVSLNANALLGLTEGEKVAGFVHIGKAVEAPLERVRPDLSTLVSRWGE